MWPSNISVGPDPPPPSITAITLGRPGCTSSSSGAQPNDRIVAATSSAAGCSLSSRIGSWTLGMRTSCWVSSTRAVASMAVIAVRRQVGGENRPSAAVQPPSTKIVVPVT